MNARFPHGSLTLLSTLALAAALAACGAGLPPAETSTPEPEPAAAASGVVAEDAGAPSSSTPAASSSSESSETEPPKTVEAKKPDYPPFDSLKAGEKMEHMKTVVTPKMKALFQEFDAKEFANFSCGTCHGKGARSGTFKMPNADLPKLDVSDHFAKETKAHPEMMKFMGEKVVPEMANLLGEAPYNPETQTGFGCFGCHTKK